MNTLRARLILGFSLLAVVPLAIAIYLLTVRLEAMVRSQAEERLTATLGSIRSDAAADGAAIAAKLAILARDPMLRRLFLVRPAEGRELSDYLAERRVLLGLDFLEVADTTGATIATEGRSTPGDSGLAMAASAPIRYQNEAAGLLRGGVIFDAAFLRQLREVGGVDLALLDSSGRVVASTLGHAQPTGFARTDGPARVVMAGATYLSRSVPLNLGGEPAAIAAFASTAGADRTVFTLQAASALLGLLGLGLAIGLATLWSSQVSRPVERLAAFSERLAKGEWDEPLELRSVREIQTLADALDRMRHDLRNYRQKLLVSERQAAWGQMARKVAHEIKNPLTPIAISVADLKRSYDQKRPDFPEILDQAARTVADEVETLRRLLQEFSEFGRFPSPRLAPCNLADLFSDLEALYAREVAAGRLVVARPDRDVEFTADRGQIRQALVNLVKNGLEATEGRDAAEGSVTIAARRSAGELEIDVSDTGAGLTPEQRANLFAPGFTTKAEGSGLGLTIVERIVSDHHGSVAVDAAGTGTTFRIRLPLDKRS
jgi:signal transduction histidine kinase